MGYASDRQEAIRLLIIGEDRASPAIKEVTKNVEGMKASLGVGGTFLAGATGGAVAVAMAAIGTALRNLIATPIEAARSFAELSKQMGMTTTNLHGAAKAAATARTEYEHLATVIGSDGVVALTALTEAQKASDRAWKDMAITLAVSFAPQMTKVAEMTRDFAQGVAFAFGRAPWAIALEKGDTERGRFGLVQLTPEQQRSIADSKNREAQAELKKAEAMEREAEALRKSAIQQAAMLAAQYTAGRMIGPRTFEEFTQLRPVPGEEDFGIPGVPFLRPGGDRGELAVFDRLATLKDAATQTVQGIASAFVAIAAGVGTTIRSMGDALRSFLGMVLSTVLSTLAQLGLQFLGGLFPAGGVLGFIGKVLSGGKSATIKTSPTQINIFNGLNMRTLYNEAVSGSLAQTNDLIRMRAELA